MKKSSQKLSVLINPLEDPQENIEKSMGKLLIHFTLSTYRNHSKNSYYYFKYILIWEKTYILNPFYNKLGIITFFSLYFT